MSAHSQWLTTYATLVLELDYPILEALDAYWSAVYRTLEQLRPYARNKNMDPLIWKQYQDPGFLMLWVREDGMRLRTVVDQTPELCLAAVQQTPQALKLVHCQTAELRLAAVTRDGMTLQHCHKHTTVLCLAAVSQNPEALQYVSAALQKREPRIAMTAVSSKGTTLRHVVPALQKLPIYRDICNAAVQQAPRARTLLPLGW